jgi:hypothetical protein
MVHFIPCHKEIIVNESTNLLIYYSYRLHGVSKVILSDSDPHFVGKWWQSLTGNKDTLLNMSIARSPQIDGLTERMSETMKITLRCYTNESRFTLVISFAIAEFHFNYLYAILIRFTVLGNRKNGGGWMSVRIKFVWGI